jgi:hypothetical protein
MVETDSCTGPSALIAMKMTPTAAREPPSGAPPWTAPTSAPMASVNSAGRAPRTTIKDHQAAARPRDADASAASSRHSAEERADCSAAGLTRRAPGARNQSEVVASRSGT